MNSKDLARLKKLKAHWQSFAPGELEHSIRCINELKNVPWAVGLAAKAFPVIALNDWRLANYDAQDQPAGLENWEKIEKLRATLFEVRYAYDLFKRGLQPECEKKTVGNSDVDFGITFGASTYLVELVSTQQTDSMTENTEHVTLLRSSWVLIRRLSC